LPFASVRVLKTTFVDRLIASLAAVIWSFGSGDDEAGARVA